MKIVHMVPGRIRFSCPSLKKGELSADRLQQPLRSFSFLNDSEANPITGSLIIRFNPLQHKPKEIFLCLIRSYPWARIIAPARSPGKHLTSRGAKMPPPFERDLQRLALVSISLLGALFVRGRFEKGYNTTIPYLLAFLGTPIFKKAHRTLTRDRCLGIDLLDTVAITLSIVGKRYLPAMFMVWLYSLGDLIKNRTKDYSRRTIRDLMRVNENTAWILKEGRETPVDVKAIKPGDRVIVHTGELIPVDGVVSDGAALVDQRSLTGESLPVHKKRGDPVYTSTRLEEGKILIEAQKVGEYTLAANTIKVIEQAFQQNTHFQYKAERLANRLVPLTLLGAGFSFLLTGSLRSAMAVLMVDYGTGIRVAVPTVIMAGLIRAARRGIFIKSGTCLERLAEADTVIFDKTGTLTHGLPEVTKVISYDEGVTPETIVALAAAAETRTTHPVARAIRNKARQWNLEIPKAVLSDCDVGFGVAARVGERNILLGSQAYMKRHKVDCHVTHQDMGHIHVHGQSMILMSVNNRLTGSIIYQDALRAESRGVIEGLKSRGVKREILISGDSWPVTRRVSRTVGIEKYYGETFPKQKGRIISGLKEKGHVTVMVGDGINDGPALALSDVSISMKESSDVAREVADIVLLNNKLTGLLDVIDISQQTMSTVREGYRMILFPSAIAMGLAFFGWISPSMATAMNDIPTVLATINGLRSLKSGSTHRSSGNYSKRGLG